MIFVISSFFFYVDVPNSFLAEGVNLFKYV